MSDPIELPLVAYMANSVREAWPIEGLVSDLPEWHMSKKWCMGQTEWHMHALVLHEYFHARPATFGGATEGRGGAAAGGAAEAPPSLDSLMKAIERAPEQTLDAVLMAGAYTASTRAHTLRSDRIAPLLFQPLLRRTRPSPFLAMLLVRARLSIVYIQHATAIDPGLWAWLALHDPRGLATALDRFHSGFMRKHKVVWRIYLHTAKRMLTHPEKEVNASAWLDHSPYLLFARSFKPNSSIDPKYQYAILCFMGQLRDILNEKLKDGEEDDGDNLQEAMRDFLKELNRLLFTKKSTVQSSTGLRVGIAPLRFFDLPLTRTRDWLMFRAVAVLCRMPKRDNDDDDDYVVCHGSAVPPLFAHCFAHLLDNLYNRVHESNPMRPPPPNTPDWAISCVAAMCVHMALRTDFNRVQLQMHIVTLLKDLVRFLEKRHPPELITEILARNVPRILQLELLRRHMHEVHDMLVDDTVTLYAKDPVALLACARWAPVWCSERVLKPLLRKRNVVVFPVSRWDLLLVMADHLALEFQLALKFRPGDPPIWATGWLPTNYAQFPGVIDLLLRGEYRSMFMPPTDGTEYSRRRQFFLRLEQSYTGLTREITPGLSSEQYHRMAVPLFTDLYERVQAWHKQVEAFDLNLKEIIRRREDRPKLRPRAEWSTPQLTLEGAKALVDAAFSACAGEEDPEDDPTMTKTTKTMTDAQRTDFIEVLVRYYNDDNPETNEPADALALFIKEQSIPWSSRLKVTFVNYIRKKVWEMRA